MRRRVSVPVAMAGLALALQACAGGESGGGEARSGAISAGNAGVGEAARPGPVSEARRQVLVVTEEPDDTQGRLYRMEWVEGLWRQVGPPLPVVVGWGGIGPKREGDGRSPEGTFPLGPAFGYSPDPPPGLGTAPASGHSAEAAGPPDRDRALGRDSSPDLTASPDAAGGSEWNLPYVPMTAGSVCVDDPASAFYNRIVDPDTLFDASRVPRDWTSAEAMRRDLAHHDDLYSWGVEVRYNLEAEPGAGSCIFLHVWRDPQSPTAGCTAMAQEDLLELMGWLAGTAGEGPGPILVQGTRAYLEELVRQGRLPYPVPPPS